MSTPQETCTTTALLGWNVQGGGYDRRHVFDDSEGPGAATPEREAAIKEFIEKQRLDGVNSVALTDTYGWQQRYGSDANIACHLGFSDARFVLLQDERIDRVMGPGAGLTFATNHVIERSSPIDLDNRQALGTILNLGGRALQIATVYLDDMNEGIRLRQLRALLANLEPEPTVIIGDLNSLRPNMQGASLSTQAHDLGFRAIAFSCAFIPGKKILEPIFALVGRAQLAATVDYYTRCALPELNRRRVIPVLSEDGWQDADPAKQPTYHRLGGLCLDYAFHNNGVSVSNFQVVPAGPASDHDAIRVQASVVLQTRATTGKTPSILLQSSK